MPFIGWIDDEDAAGELAEVYRRYKAANPHRPRMPDILKCFSHRPDFLQQVIDFSFGTHFSQGHLDRRTKEMIASYVSALNQCPYWLGSHAYFLQLQGADDACIAAVSRRDLDSESLTDPERALMRFVELITLHAWKNTADDVQHVRDAGWSEEQIAEAVYITALFAFFNRVADAFGLQDPGYLQMSPETRPEGPKEQPKQ